MFKDRKIIVLGLIAYLLCVYVTYILYSPKISVTAIEQALQQKNVEKLDYYIDYSSIQQGLIAQLKTELILKASQRSGQLDATDPITVAKVSYATKVVEDFVHLFFSSNGLSRLFELGESQSENEITVSAKKYISNLQSPSFIDFDGFEFISLNSIYVKGESLDGKQHHFIFTFRYTRWVMTDILMDLRSIDSKKVVSFIQSFQ